MKTAEALNYIKELRTASLEHGVVNAKVFTHCYQVMSLCNFSPS